MRLAGLSWRALLGIGLVLVVSLGTSLALLTRELERSRNQALDEELLGQARRLARILRPDWEQHDAQRLEQAVDLLRDADTAIVIVRADGLVLLDTTAGFASARALLVFPEVREALKSGVGLDARGGIQHGILSRIVARRVEQQTGQPVIVWLARPAWRLRNDRAAFRRVLGAVGVTAVGTVLALGISLTYRRTYLLRRISRVARNLARGDLTIRADVPGSDEWAVLARALNETRRRIVADAETIDHQRRTLEALLSQLGEGVVVVRGDGRITWINPAAVRLLNLSTESHVDCQTLVGQAVEQCVPQHELLRLLQTAQAAWLKLPAAADQIAPAAAGAVRETRLQVEAAGGTMHLLARVSELILPEVDQSGGAAIGWLLVVTDITELGRALQIQTEFVANASHELRTPLSSIRAAVETLLQMDLVKEAENATRFLQIIDRHSERLQAMVADLLELSRLDGKPPASFEPGRYRLADISRGVEERFSEALRARGLDWQCHYRPGHEVVIVVNAYLLRLALDNLVNNAIKFTEPGGHVRLTCQVGPDHACFEVADNGCGIPPADQSRVFDRFYQVERARSDPERGTGLGLSIVRQAVDAMGGSVTLQSEPGRGTRVTIRVPQPSGDVS